MIYVHIPFCRSFCLYCDFYSETRGEQDALFPAIGREARMRADEIRRFADPFTLYFGGGTPSLFPARSISELSSLLLSISGREMFEEFTVEVNPDDITPEYARALRDCGVSRVSMGVQSFDDAHLKWMGRRHDASKAVSAFVDLRRAGFDNISIDLIFGYDPCFSAGGARSAAKSLADSWSRDLDAALRLAPEHISAYQMGIEEGSTLGEMYVRGLYAPPDDEVCAMQYDLLCRRLAAGGYVHYEISNFSLPGKAALHNSAYWDRKPYVGLGPAAHSFNGAQRFWNVADVKAYCASGAAGAELRGYESLSEDEIRTETIMLGLRRSAGLPPDVFGKQALEALERLEAAGSLISDGRSVRIPEEKWFISDSIIKELI